MQPPLALLLHAEHAVRAQQAKVGAGNVHGKPGQLRESDINPKYLIGQIKKAGGEIPDLYLACGTEDSLIDENRSFRAYLEENQIPVLYHEQPGEHDWDYWNKELQPAVRWLME